VVFYSEIKSLKMEKALIHVAPTLMFTVRIKKREIDRKIVLPLMVYAGTSLGFEEP